MSFIQRELDRIGEALRQEPLDTPRYERLYIAQQALVWVLEPDVYRSPFNSVMGTDTKAPSRPPPVPEIAAS